MRTRFFLLFLCSCGAAPTVETPAPTRFVSSAEITCDPVCGASEVCTAGNLCEVIPAPPQLLSPVSTTVVPGDVRVTWLNGASADASEISLYKERDCLTLLLVQSGANEVKFTNLAPGAYFVRARGQRTLVSGEVIFGSTTNVREFFVSARRGNQPLQLQPLADFDGDGKADLTISNGRAFGGQNIYSSDYNYNEHEWRSFDSTGYDSLAGADFRVYAYSPARALFAHTGQSVGDVDGDGFSDFAAIDGQPATDYTTSPPTYPALPIRLYYGSPLGLTKNGLQNYRTPEGGAYVGFFSLGDVDGDGFSDVGVMQSSYSSNDIRTTVIFGGGPTPPAFRGGLTNRTISTTLLLPKLDRVVPVGDLDGDGTSELAMLTRDGQTRIVSVQKNGSTVLTSLVLDGLVDVASVGDVNGDGLADVGGNRVRTQSNIHDRLPKTALVLFGGSDLLSYARAREIDYPIITSQQYDCSRPATWQWGDAPLCLVVGTLSGGSDINHDGNPDVFMTGAVEVAPTGIFPYRHFSHVWVYQNIEQNTQALASVLELFNPDDELNLYDSYFGERSIASVGDVTGDGIDDLAIASGLIDQRNSGGLDPNRWVAAKVRIYGGSVSGLTTIPALEYASSEPGFAGSMLSLGLR